LAQQPPAQRDRLVLLGAKGGPFISGYAPGPSCNLLVYRGTPCVVDAGYGVTFKLIEAGVPPAQIRHVFITHHHSDHNIELGPLLYNAWASGLNAPVEVHGPAGLNALIAAYWESNRFDIETRIADEGRPDLRRLVAPHEYAEGDVLSDADVEVTALRNRHPPVTESFALKFKLAEKTLVFSGDTTYFPPLADFARGADILVHEVMYGPALEALVRRRPNAATLMAHLTASHTLAADVGRIASAANVKTLVLNHFVPADDKSLTPQMWIDAVRPTFAGAIIAARDGLEISL
jgi:ribonuclease BN (tRNA processing enzyme)